MMTSRLQTSRALLNVQPLVLKQQTSVSSSDGEQQSTGSGTGSSSGSLSPSIQSTNDISSLLITTGETEVQPADNQRKYFELGDYLLFEEAQSQQQQLGANGSNNDVYGSALHMTSKQVFYWKKFHQRDYMKKLEPYFIMEGCSDNVYKFSEIIHESNFNDAAGATTTGSENVYVFFKPHYGDLHSYMKEKKRLSENEARGIFRQCVEAVRACHENNIIIRDIKLKKFVFLDPAKTKIGLANLQDCLLLDEDAENDLIKSQQGCPAYVSPEVLNPLQTFYSGKLSDSWSLGIILYTLLVGRYPFHHPTIANMFARISRGKFHVPTSISLSLDARTLLRSLIRIKADERLLPHEILEHNWFRQNEPESVARLMHLQSAYNQHHTNNLLNELKLMNKIHVGISLSSPRVVSFLTSSSNSTCALSNTNNNTNNTSNHLMLALNSKTNNSNGTVNDDCIVPSSSSITSSN